MYINVLRGNTHPHICTLFGTIISTDNSWSKVGIPGLKVIRYGLNLMDYLSNKKCDDESTV